MYLLILGNAFQQILIWICFGQIETFLNFATSVLRVNSEHALAGSGSCARSTRCIPLLCRDLVREESTGICLPVCTPVSEPKLDTDARMHPSHRPVSCVFIGSRAQPCCYITLEALVREVALLEREVLREPVMVFSQRAEAALWRASSGGKGMSLQRRPYLSLCSLQVCCSPYLM